MKAVGDHLKSVANQSKCASQQDVFGRSAFNRYYYAAFLVTRQVLIDIGQWNPKVGHKALPGYIQSSVVNAVKAGIGGRRTAGPYPSYYYNAQRAGAELARLLEKAYCVRRIADYEPQTPVSVSGGHLVLEQMSLEAAANWAATAAKLVGDLRRAYQDAGLV